MGSCRWGVCKRGGVQMGEEHLGKYGGGGSRNGGRPCTGLLRGGLGVQTGSAGVQGVQGVQGRGGICAHRAFARGWACKVLPMGGAARRRACAQWVCKGCTQQCAVSVRGSCTRGVPRGVARVQKLGTRGALLVRGLLTASVQTAPACARGGCGSGGAKGGGESLARASSRARLSHGAVRPTLGPGAGVGAGVAGWGLRSRGNRPPPPCTRVF